MDILLSTNKWIICRICLKSSTDGMRQIFSMCAVEEDLVAKIMEYGGIQLDDSDKLPDKICSKCLTLLRVAHKFRTLCQKSQQQLMKLLQPPGPREKEDDDLVNVPTGQETVDVAPSAVKSETESAQEDLSGDGMRYITESETSEDQYTEPEIRIMESSGYIELVDSNHHDIEYLQDEMDELEAVVGDGNVEPLTSHESNNNKYIENVPQVSEQTFDTLPSTEDPSADIEIFKFRKRKNGDKKPKKSRRKSFENPEDNDSKIYICFHCGNTYAERAKLTLHLKIHTNDKPHECEICHKRFSQTPQLSRHMNSHTGSRPFKCKFCPSSFADPSTCIKHERIHTNVRPYKCEACGKAFSYSNVLKVHMMTHTGERPFSCKFCLKKFTQLHHKKAHERTHNSQPIVKQEDFEVLQEFNYD